MSTSLLCKVATARGHSHICNSDHTLVALPPGGDYRDGHIRSQRLSSAYCVDMKHFKNETHKRRTIYECDKCRQPLH